MQSYFHATQAGKPGSWVHRKQTAFNLRLMPLQGSGQHQMLIAHATEVMGEICCHHMNQMV